MAAVVDEAVAAHDQVFRKHDRGPGCVVAKRVVLEKIPVRIHVVQPVTDVVDSVVFDARIDGE